MNKGLKIFTKIIYYVFTFLIGILIAIMLPLTLTVTYIPEEINKSIQANQYDQAIQLVYGGGYYNASKIYQEDIGEGGIIIFESTNLNYGVENETDGTKLIYSYSGLLYGVDSYNVSSTANNQTKLIVVDNSSNSYTVDLLDYDSNNDEVNDTISYYQGFKFVFFGIEKINIPSVKQIKFLDKDGSEFYSKTFDTALSYESNFYDDVEAFVNEFNLDNASSSLSTLDEEFRNKNDNYQMFSYQRAVSRANKKSVGIVIVYFLIIYVFADLVLGKRYIIKFFSWLLFKVFKIKRKQKEPKEEEILGNDYLSTVKFVLDKSSCPEFKTSISIKYSGEEDIEVSLYDDEKYCCVKKIKAGKYVNPFITIDDEYQLLDLPAPLVVKGYNMQIDLKLKKVERVD